MLLPRLFAAASAALLISTSAACAPPSLPGAPATSPPTAGLDPALMAQAVAQAQALPKLNAMIVARNSEVIFERAFRGPSLETPVNIKSASKTVLSALAGTAIERGVLKGVDQPIAPILGPRMPSDADPVARQLTVQNLLTMETGLQSTSGANYGAWASSRDWVAFALRQPVVDRPGGRLIYSTGTSHVLSTVLTRASGRSTLQLARDWLGEPLNITVPAWPQDPQGVYIGGNEMRLSPRALLRFGELYRNGGVHAGRRVLPAGWVKDSWTPRGTSQWTGARYGYGWWIKEARGHPVYYAWGYGGQMVFVIPDLALTVVMTSDSAPTPRDFHVSALHQLLDDLIVPAAERGRAAGQTQAG